MKNRTGCSFISKKDSVMLQGVAVSLMVWHHLFGFPERISVPYILPLDCIGHIETILSYFGRICIAMFAFLSGYGMQKKALSTSSGLKIDFISDWRNVLKHLLKFYSRYWVVFFIFVPVGLILTVYPVDISQLFKGLFGLTTVYNAEWWYITSYLCVMLLFPFLNLLMNLAEKGGNVVFHIVSLAALLGVGLLAENSSNGTYSVLLYFLEGMYFAESALFTKISQKIPLPKFLVGTVLIAAVFILRTLGLRDYLLVPFMIMGCVMFLNSKFTGRLHGVFSVIGRYSTYIWLTHTFFGYYYFQAFTFFPRYSQLIFLWCLILCLIFGILAELFLKQFNRNIPDTRSNPS